MLENLHIKVTKNEYKKLKKLKSETSMNQSEIIRSILDYLDPKQFAISSAKIDKQNKKVENLYAVEKYRSLLLHNIANNYNQIAHRLNTIKTLDSENTFYIKENMDKINAEFKKLRQALKNGNN